MLKKILLPVFCSMLWSTVVFAEVLSVNLTTNAQWNLFTIVNPVQIAYNATNVYGDGSMTLNGGISEKPFDVVVEYYIQYMQAGTGGFYIGDLSFEWDFQGWQAVDRSSPGSPVTIQRQNQPAAWSGKTIRAVISYDDVANEITVSQTGFDAVVFSWTYSEDNPQFKIWSSVDNIGNCPKWKAVSIVGYETSPTNTPTPTETFTPSNTPTPTFTPSNTPVPGTTPTFTPTIAPTSTLPPWVWIGEDWFKVWRTVTDSEGDVHWEEWWTYHLRKTDNSEMYVPAPTLEHTYTPTPLPTITPTFTPTEGPMEDLLVQNQKTGIDVTFSGTRNVNYAEEYFYHDPLVDDHKVVFIESTVPIVMKHNAKNTRAGQNASTVIGEHGVDGVPNTGDEGIIRYKVDMDLQRKWRWAPYPDATNLLPAYPGPISFGEMTYPGTAVSVVGSTGGAPGTVVTDRTTYYHRGIIGPASNEWHVLAVADDDSGWNGSDTEKWSSDGKTILFVVNPETPCISFEKTSATAQWFTTPPKAYFIPVIHEQTTYLTDDVEISLVNIMEGTTYYRFDNDSFAPYTEPLSSNDLSDGTTVLQYYYDAAHIAERLIVKNPPFPSDADVFDHDSSTHGYLFWPNETKFQEFRTRCLPGGVKAGAYNYWKTNSNNKHTVANTTLMRGNRTSVEASLYNAIYAAVEGATAVPNHARFSKMMLLDSTLNIDNVGFEILDSFNPIPSKERTNRGYYDVNIAIQNALAYDLMIKFYRSTTFANGITPIEDYKIRDLLALWAFECMMTLGGFEADTTGVNAGPTDGMWDTAKQIGALVVAMAMPSYNTPYYGTSGFDGTEATHLWAPYRDYPVTWKEAFYTEVQNTDYLYGFPNQRALFNQVYGGIITGATVNVTPNTRRWEDGTYVTSIPPGNFADRKGYYSYHLMGHCFHVLSNLMATKFDHHYTLLEQSYVWANEGKLFGVKVEPSVASDYNASSYPQLLLINEYFPTLAQPSYDYIYSFDPNHANGVNQQNYQTLPFSLIWFYSDWESYLE